MGWVDVECGAEWMGMGPMDESGVGGYQMGETCLYVSEYQRVHGAI